jgi:hypothetical protein
MPCGEKPSIVAPEQKALEVLMCWFSLKWKKPWFELATQEHKRDAFFLIDQSPGALKCRARLRWEEECMVRLVRCGFTGGKPPVAAGGLIGGFCLWSKVKCEFRVSTCSPKTVSVVPGPNLCMGWSPFYRVERANHPETQSHDQ